MAHSGKFYSEMIRSELEEIVGSSFVSVDENDKLVYSTDWSWMPQMWLDRGQRRPHGASRQQPGGEVSKGRDGGGVRRRADT